MSAKLPLDHEFQGLITDDKCQAWVRHGDIGCKRRCDYPRASHVKDAGPSVQMPATGNGETPAARAADVICTALHRRFGIVFDRENCAAVIEREYAKP